MAGGQIVVPPSTVPAGVLPPPCFHHVPLLLLLLLLGAPAVVPDLLREGLLHLLIANLDQGGRGEEDNWDEREFSHQQQVENSIRIFADVLWDQDWGVLNCACCRWKTLMRRRYLGNLQRWGIFQKAQLKRIVANIYRSLEQLSRLLSQSLKKPFHETVVCCYLGSLSLSVQTVISFQSCTILSADRLLWKSICCMLYLYSFWGHWCINRIRWRHPQPWHEQRTKKQRISLNFCWQQIRPRVVARDGSDLFLFVQSPNQRHTRLYHTG